MADKAGLVCTSMQLRGTRRVDEVLLRALTAGVRRSAGDAGFRLGCWEPDRAWGHTGRVAAEDHSTVTRLISPHRCTQHIHTHSFHCPPHTDNGQMFVIKKAGSSYCAAGLSIQFLQTRQSEKRAEERESVNYTSSPEMLYGALIGTLPNVQVMQVQDLCVFWMFVRIKSILLMPLKFQFHFPKTKSVKVCYWRF